MLRIGLKTRAWRMGASSSRRVWKPWQTRRDWGGQRYSSARLVTRGRAAWTYGFFEIRAKLPCVLGTWPAAWLLPSTRDPDFSNGEIDIFEHVAHQAGWVRHSVHTKRRNFRRGNHPTGASHVPDACDAFHTYQLHWTADEITMGVDGRRAFSYGRKLRQSQDWPFDAPFYLIINLAFGGHWAGSQGLDSEGLPARLEVDYVRVYGPR